MFSLFVELLIFCTVFPILLKCSFVCSLVALCVSSEQLFLILCQAIMDLHFFGVSYWKFIVFLWWCHVSLTHHDLCSLVYGSAHFKQLPLPDLWTKFSMKKPSLVCHSMLEYAVALGLVV